MLGGLKKYMCFKGRKFLLVTPENENGQGAELECTTVLQSGSDGANQKMRSRNKFLNSL